MSDWITRRKPRSTPLTQQIEATERAQARGASMARRGGRPVRWPPTCPDVGGAIRREFTELNARTEERPATGRPGKRLRGAERRAAGRTGWSGHLRGRGGRRRPADVDQRATCPSMVLASRTTSFWTGSVRPGQHRQTARGRRRHGGSPPIPGCVVLIRNGSLGLQQGSSAARLIDKYDAQAIVERTTDGTATKVRVRHPRGRALSREVGK